MSELRGEYGFPMSAGGRVIGVLVVGPKRLGESFAPDECDAIAEVAHSVGVALALLGASRAVPTSEQTAMLARLMAAIESLPEEFAAKLRSAV